MTLGHVSRWKKISVITTAALSLVVIAGILLAWPEQKTIDFEDANVSNLNSLQNDVWQWYGMEKYVPIAIRRIEKTTTHPVWGVRYDLFLCYQIQPIDHAPLLARWSELEAPSDDPLFQPNLGSFIQREDKKYFPAWWKPERQLREFQIGNSSHEIFLRRDGNQITIFFIGGEYSSPWEHR